MKRIPMHPRRRLVSIMTGVEQLIRDLEYWNGLHPELVPLDVEPERVYLSICHKALVAWDTGDRVEFKRLVGEMIRYGARHLIS